MINNELSTSQQEQQEFSTILNETEEPLFGASYSWDLNFNISSGHIRNKNESSKRIVTIGVPIVASLILLSIIGLGLLFRKRINSIIKKDKSNNKNIQDDHHNHHHHDRNNNKTSSITLTTINNNVTTPPTTTSINDDHSNSSSNDTINNNNNNELKLDYNSINFEWET